MTAISITVQSGRQETQPTVALSEQESVSIILQSDEGEIPEGDVRVATSTPPGVTVSIACTEVVAPNVWKVETSIPSNGVVSLPIRIMETEFPTPDSDSGKIMIHVSEKEELRSRAEIPVQYGTS